jgi:hypothetical protein
MEVEKAAVVKHISQSNVVRSWLGGLAATSLAIALAGCTPQGTGTVDVGSPGDVRSKLEGNKPSNKPRTAKEARALEGEAAANKIPKLN